MPRVSIIMGVYNVKSIEELEITAKSIIEQTYTDWEFIICDDGSSNNTFELLKRIEAMDSRIKAIGYKENKGLSTALNTCIEASTGEYIARQDAEDISHPQRLEKEIEFLDTHPEYDLVGCNAYIYDHENGRWGEYLNKEIPVASDFLWTTQFLHPTVIFRRESLIKAGKYRVSKETKRSQDYDLFMTMYSLGMKGYNIQSKMFDYYQKDGHQRELTWGKRFREAQIRYKGFKKLHLFPKAFPYVVKPLVVKIIPQKIYRKLKKSEGAGAK
ncbi:MAG: glycosyltransferase [Ruminococcus sp.]|nr:glycosyltransferase [Ruminococcus sp.]